MTTRHVRHDDAAFLFELYASTRREEFAAWNLPADACAALLHMQHKCQQQSYALHHPHAVDRIVLHEGVRAGRILTAISGSELVLVDLSLLPEHRRNGLGTKLIRDLQERAAHACCALRLHVLADNPARSLYARLGFHEDGRKPPYVSMLWHARAALPAVRHDGMNTENRITRERAS